MKGLSPTVGIQFKNLLFATDLSPASERALPYAIEMARRYGTKIHMVHVVQPIFYPLVPPEVLARLAEVQGEFHRDRRRELDKQLREIAHETIFQDGEIWPTLAEIIEKKEIDLLVLSTQGQSNIENVLLGSVAEQIFRRAHCPVITVGPCAPPAPRHAAELNRILYATDFSAESLAGAPYAISMALEHRAQLILLHCLQGSGDVSAMLRALRGIVRYDSELRCEPICVVEPGSPATKILEVAKGHGADMIVLGVHGDDKRFANTAHYVRSGTHRIVTTAMCPVLTVRK